jgi:hypothetical protein
VLNRAVQRRIDDLLCSCTRAPFRGFGGPPPSPDTHRCCPGVRATDSRAIRPEAPYGSPVSNRHTDGHIRASSVARRSLITAASSYRTQHRTNPSNRCQVSVPNAGSINAGLLAPLGKAHPTPGPHQTHPFRYSRRAHRPAVNQSQHNVGSQRPMGHVPSRPCRRYPR